MIHQEACPAAGTALEAIMTNTSLEMSDHMPCFQPVIEATTMVSQGSQTVKLDESLHKVTWKRAAST